MDSNLQTLFNQAVDLQSQNKDEEALELYKKIREENVTSSSLEMNEALIYEQKKDWGQALQRIDKAQLLSRRPWFAGDVATRIERKVSASRAQSMGTTNELLYDMSKMIRPEEALWGASALLGVFLILRAFGSKNKNHWWIIGVSSLLFIFGVAAINSAKPAYVLQDTETRAVPLSTAPTKLLLPKGSKVIVKRKGKEYSEISRSNEFNGWIPNSALE